MFRADFLWNVRNEDGNQPIPASVGTDDEPFMLVEKERRVQSFGILSRFTFAAWGPLVPCSTSKLTDSPSLRDL